MQAELEIRRRPGFARPALKNGVADDDTLIPLTGLVPQGKTNQIANVTWGVVHVQSTLAHNHPITVVEPTVCLQSQPLKVRAGVRHHWDAQSGAHLIQGADVIVNLCESMDNLNVRAATMKAREKGTCIVSTEPRGIEDFVIESVLADDYPLMIKVAEKICELWEKTEVCQVTSPLGTDVSFRLKGRPGTVVDGMATEPGELDYFPNAAVSIAPVEETINGTIVIDGCISPGGLVSAPITFGFGNQDPSYKGTVGAAKVHFDAVLLSPTVYLDGVVMRENNKWNPDLGLSGL